MNSPKTYCFYQMENIIYFKSHCSCSKTYFKDNVRLVVVLEIIAFNSDRENILYN